jgi:hypothetical protein
VVQNTAKDIVISYAREDRGIVEDLAGTLRALGHHIWTDAGAHSGGRWWDEIVSHIRTCDVLLAVTSPASLVSNACSLERQYAMRLNKVLLPVLVAPVNMQSLPSEFATIHFFDLTVRDVAAAGRLYQAVQQLPPPGPLPHPLPPPPPPPLSYLNEIADRITTLVPDAYLQDRIVTDLTRGLRSADPEERATATELLSRFLDHPQRLEDPAGRAREALSRAAGTQSAGQAAPAAAPRSVRRSRFTTVLAWIGGVTVVLIGLGIWGATSIGSGSGGGGTSSIVPGATVSQSVYNDLVTNGYQPGTVTCGDLEAVVGATTYCSSPGLPNGGTTVRVTSVQGATVSSWTYE